MLFPVWLQASTPVLICNGKASNISRIRLFLWSVMSAGRKCSNVSEEVRVCPDFSR